MLGGSSQLFLWSAGCPMGLKQWLNYSMGYRSAPVELPDWDRPAGGLSGSCGHPGKDYGLNRHPVGWAATAP